MNLVSWVLVLSVSWGAPLPDDLAKHKEFNTYEQCYTYKDKLLDLMASPTRGWDKKTKYSNDVVASCVPVSGD